VPIPTSEAASEVIPSAAPELALLYTDTNFISELIQHPPVSTDLHPIDIYDLAETDLSPYLGLAVPGLTDQEHLWRHADKIRAFLDAGKVVVYSGMLFRPWLPGAGMLVPKTIHSHRDYFLTQVTPSPIFEGIAIEDLVFRRGVAGFFARGHHQPPPGAEVILELPGGEPALYVDRVSTNGTILVHGGNDMLGFANDTTTASRLTPQLLAWMRDEARERMARLKAGVPAGMPVGAEVTA
jgi:hypothetical protein